MSSCLSLSLVKQVMFSLDAATTNILLIAGVIALVIFFITVLMKLNPSPETKENLKKTITLETQKPPQPLQTVQGAAQNRQEEKESVPAIVERPPVPLNITVAGPSVPLTQENKTPVINKGKEAISKHERIAAPKAEINSSSKRDCLHQFGYLRTLPKNTPIPDECFGCTKIVECLVKAKTR